MSANDPFTPEDYARFTLRIPEKLFSVIKDEAKKNKRSTGKQIEFILEQYLSQDCSNNHEE